MHPALKFFVHTGFLLAITIAFASRCAANPQDIGEAEKNAKKSFALTDRMPDSALLLANAGIACATKINDKNGYASCLNAKALALQRLGNNDSAEWIYEQSINEFEVLNNKKDAARVLINLSQLYTAKELYELALQRVLKAKNYMQSSNDESGIAYSEKVIGILYRQQGNYDLAILYLRAAIHDFELTHDTIFIGDAMSSLGIVYSTINKPDSAFYYYQCSLEIFARLKNKSGMAYGDENVGDTYYKLANHKNNDWIDSALRYYQKAYDLFQELHSRQNMAYEKMNIGNALVVKQNDVPATQYFKEALAVFDSVKDYSSAYSTLDQLKNLASKSGDFRQAYEYAVQELIYKDTLASGNRKDVMATMFAKYEVDKRDRTIALLNTQEKLTQQELHNSRVLDFVYLVLAIIGLILTVLLFNFYRVRQQLKEVKIRNQLASDLHDDVGSSLSSILLLSKMAQSSQADKKTLEELITTIRINAGEVIERMSDIVWTTDPKFDNGGNLIARMDSYLLQCQQGTSTIITTDISEEIVKAGYSMQVRKNIFLIFKEAVNNALKHAAAKDLHIGLGIKNGLLQLCVTDNGKGFDLHKTHAGFGLNTMKQRAAALDATITIGSNEQGGTSILLQIPLKTYSF